MAEQRIDINVGKVGEADVLESGADGTEEGMHIVVGGVVAVGATIFSLFVGEEPAQFGVNHHITHVLIRPVVQVVGYFGAAPHPDVVDSLQGQADGVSASFADIDVSWCIALDVIIPFFLQVLAGIYVFFGHRKGHTVVAHHNEVDFVADGKLLNAFVEVADQLVDFHHRYTCLLGLRAVNVAVVVGLLEIGHDELRPFSLGTSELLQDAVDALAESEAWLLVIVEILVWILALHSHIRTRPVEDSCAQTLTLGSQPDGLTAVVARIVLDFSVAQREFLACGTVDELVADDAVVVGIETGGQRVMVGESSEIMTVT